jgi:Fe-S cluster biogenesis protein NfuA
MIDGNALAGALDEARAIVQVDGADFELVAVDDELGQVELRLLLVEAGCAECVMPQQFLEGVVLDILHRVVPAVRAVRVEDPRVEESP